MKVDMIVRQYHHAGLYNDFKITYVHGNGALDVVGLDGTAYGLSESRVTIAPEINQFTEIKCKT